MPVAASTTLQVPASRPGAALMVHLTVTRRSGPALTGGVVHSPRVDVQLVADAEFTSPASAHKAVVIRTVFKVLCIDMKFPFKQKVEQTPARGFIANLGRRHEPPDHRHVSHASLEASRRPSQAPVTQQIGTCSQSPDPLSHSEAAGATGPTPNGRSVDAARHPIALFVRAIGCHSAAVRTRRRKSGRSFVTGVV